jgi:hypothetical protein
LIQLGDTLSQIGTPCCMCVFEYDQSICLLPTGNNANQWTEIRNRQNDATKSYISNISIFDETTGFPTKKNGCVDTTKQYINGGHFVADRSALSKMMMMRRRKSNPIKIKKTDNVLSLAFNLAKDSTDRSSSFVELG